MKNEILKLLGIVFILLGVLLLAAYFVGIFNSNAVLLSAGVCIFGGAIAYVVINRYIE